MKFSVDIPHATVVKTTSMFRNVVYSKKNSNAIF